MFQKSFSILGCFQLFFVLSLVCTFLPKYSMAGSGPSKPAKTNSFHKLQQTMAQQAPRSAANEPSHAEIEAAKLLADASRYSPENIPLSLLCMKTFITNKYDVTYGDRVKICNESSTEEGIKALQIVVATTKPLTDDTVRAILRSTGLKHHQCLHAFISATYDITFGRRIEICNQATMEGVEALKLLTSTKKTITDESLQEILKYRTPSSYECINTFIKHTYDWTFGNRVAICGKADDPSGILALDLIASTKKAITDEVLKELLRIHDGPKTVVHIGYPNQDNAQQSPEDLIPPGLQQHSQERN